MWSATAPRPRGAGCGGGRSRCGGADRVSSNRLVLRRGEKKHIYSAVVRKLCVCVIFLESVYLIYCGLSVLIAVIYCTAPIIHILKKKSCRVSMKSQPTRLSFRYGCVLLDVALIL